MNSTDDSLERADRYLFLGLLLILFWVPLPVASNHLWAWSFFEACVFGLAIYWLVLFAMGRVSTTLAFRRAWPALMLFVLLFAWMIIQITPLPPSLLTLLSPSGVEVHSQTQTVAALSLDPSGTREAALKTLAYGVLFALSLLLVNRRDRFRFLALVLVFSGVFQAAFGKLMTLSGLEYGFFIAKEHNIGILTGTFVNPNHLASYLEMCLALCVGLMLADMPKTPATSWRERTRRLLNSIVGVKAWVRISLIVMAIALLLSKSQIGNIAFLCSLLLATGYYMLGVRRISAGIIAIFLGVLLIEVLILRNDFGTDKISEEIRQASVATEISRVNVGRDALEIVRDYPLTGTGAGSFASTYPRYDSGKVGSWHYRYAHNDYLQFASELGLPALAMLAGIVLLSLWQTARAQLDRHDPLMGGLGCGVFMAIIALMIHATVDFTLQIPANAATFVVILAMGWHSRSLASS